MQDEQGFIDWLKTKLVELEWMQKTLADRAELSNTSISELLQGKQKLTAETAQKLAMVPELRITAWQLLRMAGLLRSQPGTSPEHEIVLGMYEGLDERSKALVLDFIEMLHIRERKNAKRKNGD